MRARRSAQEIRQSCRADYIRAESFCRENGGPYEYHHDDELRNQKWRLGLRRSQRFLRWHLLKELRDQDKDIEVKGDRR